MFTVLYKCRYRDKWYDDAHRPFATFAAAMEAAQRLKVKRAGPVKVRNNETGEETET